MTSLDLRTRVEPAVPMLVLALAVQLWRGYPVDILLHVGVLALIAIDWSATQGRTVDATPASLDPRSRVLALAAATGYGAAVSLVPQTTWWLDACLAAPGLAALWVAMGPHGAQHASTAGPRADLLDRPRRWGLWLWLALLLALFELGSFLSQPDPRTDSIDHPTLSTLGGPVLVQQPWRALSITVWALAGWWLVRRIRAWRQAS